MIHKWGTASVSSEKDKLKSFSSLAGENIVVNMHFTLLSSVLFKGPKHLSYERKQNFKSLTCFIVCNAEFFLHEL